MQFALLAKQILILKGFPELIQVMKFAVSEMEFALQKREKNSICMFHWNSCDIKWNTEWEKNHLF